jgi:signal transduction histidine kinase
LAGDWVEIEVSDTGAGIPEKNITRVLEPFFTTKEPGKGTGQGLLISHNIIT